MYENVIITCRIDSVAPPRGGGALPYISHTGMCRPKGWVFVPFQSENVYSERVNVFIVSIPNE